MSEQETKTIYLKRIESYFVREKVKANNLHKQISAPRDVFELFKSLGDETVEKFLVLHLNAHNIIVCYSLVSVGTIDRAFISPREVIKSALLSGATAIITVHNHPSGQTNPSAEDKGIASRIQRACELMCLNYYDNIIIGHDRYCSFREEGISFFKGDGKHKTKEDESLEVS